MKQKQNQKNIVIGRLLFFFIGLCGAVYTVLSAYSVQVNDIVMIFWMAVICLVLYLLICLKETDNNILLIVLRHIRMVRAAAILLYLFSGVVFFELLKCSFYGLLDSMDLGLHYDHVIMPELFLMYAVAVICLVQMLLAERGHRILYTLWLMLFLSIPVLLGKSGNMLFMLFITASAAGQSVLYHEKYDEYADKIAVMLTILLVAAYLVVLIVYPPGSFKGKTFASSIADKIEAFFIQEEVKEEVMTSGGVSDGQLGIFDSIEYSHELMLKVETECRGSLYLRGFTGSRYDSNAWKDFEDVDYAASKDVFNGLKAYGFDTLNQTGMLWQIAEQDAGLRDQLFYGKQSAQNENTDLAKCDYNITYMNASDKWWYIPYGNTVTVNRKQDKDISPVNNKLGYINGMHYTATEINYDYIKSVVDGYNGNNQVMQDYKEAESQYREYVYNMYTGVTEEVKQYIADALYPIPEMTYEQEYPDVLKEYFGEYYEYTLNPGAVPADEDFVGYFLDTSAKGYCTYFATAAVLILRNKGIPARYAEGYKVDVPEYTAAQIGVDDSMAHAWVEIYKDGYGWVAYDVTPGSIDLGLSARSQEVVLDQNTYIDKDVLEQSSVEQEALEQTGTQELQEYLGETVVSSDGTAVVPKKQYDSISEYMEDNKIKKVDFSIVLPIIGRKLLKWLVYGVKGLLVLAVICIGFYIPAKVLEKKKKRLFSIHPEQSAEQDKKQVLEIYGYVEKLGKFLKVERSSSMSYKEYANELKRSAAYFGEAGIDNLIRAVTKVSFGSGNIGKEEMKSVIRCMILIREKSYPAQTRINRLLYRYIYHL